MDTEKERLKILDMIESGQVSVEQGIQLLNALPGNNEPDLSRLQEFDRDTLTPENENESMPDSPLPQAVPVQPSAPDAAEPGITPPAVPDFAPGDETPDTISEDIPPAEEHAVPFESEPEVVPPVERFDPNKLKWHNFWLIPMWVGVSVMLISALLMYWAWSASGFGFWFACTWFPFSLGVAVMALAWSSRAARWLHVRVYQKPGERPERIAISLPIPLRLTAWFLRTFGHKIPHMEGTSLDEIIMALDATSPEAPFYVEVNEGENGERVEVYIG